MLTVIEPEPGASVSRTTRRVPPGAGMPTRIESVPVWSQVVLSHWPLASLYRSKNAKGVLVLWAAAVSVTVALPPESLMTRSANSGPSHRSGEQVPYPLSADGPPSPTFKVVCSPQCSAVPPQFTGAHVVLATQAPWSHCPEPPQTPPVTQAAPSAPNCTAHVCVASLHTPTAHAENVSAVQSLSP